MKCPKCGSEQNGAFCTECGTPLQTHMQDSKPTENTEQNAKDTSYFNVPKPDQLEFEGYSTEAATYAADNCGADWNEEAAESAKSYMDVMSFSRQGLIDQLLYEGFTQEQAEYGASAVGY